MNKQELVASLCWFVLLGLGFCGVVRSNTKDISEDTLQSKREGQLHVLTYNVSALPLWVTGNDSEARMCHIGPLLNHFDMVGLQEAFVDTYYQTLAQASSHSCQLRYSKKVSHGRIYGSGLAIFSNLSPGQVHQEHFSACHGLHADGSDCMASKGFQLVRFRLLNNVEVDVYNSHLEAGGKAGDDLARTVQVEQLIEAIHTHSAQRAIIFISDTNLYLSDPVRGPLLHRLTEETGMRCACKEVACPENEHIDRILVRSGSRVQLTVKNWTRDERFVDPQENPLSDHPAISATIHWCMETGD